MEAQAQISNSQFDPSSILDAQEKFESTQTNTQKKGVGGGKDKKPLPIVEEVISKTTACGPTEQEAVTVECIKLDLSDIKRSADILKRVFPRHLQRAITSYSELTHNEEWQFMCGLINAAYQNACFSSPVIDNAWRLPEPIVQYETICKYKECGKKFEPQWRGEKYCTNECGSKDTEKKA